MSKTFFGGWSFWLISTTGSRIDWYLSWFSFISNLNFSFWRPTFFEQPEIIDKHYLDLPIDQLGVSLYHPCPTKSGGSEGLSKIRPLTLPKIEQMFDGWPFLSWDRGCTHSPKCNHGKIGKRWRFLQKASCLEACLVVTNQHLWRGEHFQIHSRCGGKFHQFLSQPSTLQYTFQPRYCSSPCLRANSSWSVSSHVCLPAKQPVAMLLFIDLTNHPKNQQNKLPQEKFQHVF